MRIRQYIIGVLICQCLLLSGGGSGPVRVEVTRRQMLTLLAVSNAAPAMKPPIGTGGDPTMPGR